MKFSFLSLLGFGLLCSCSASGQQQAQQKNTSVVNAYIGTYTKKEGHVDGKADGILHLTINKESGEVSDIQTVAEMTNPSFVKLSPNGKFLFAVSELGQGDAEAGYIYSYATNNGGKLVPISKLSTEAFAPAHIEIDNTGNFLFVSNYMGGVVMMYKIKEDGSLKKLQRIDLENPQKSHAHSLTISPDNKTAYIADLGNDKIWIYELDVEEEKLEKASQPFVELAEGAGPRHFTISQDGRHAYSINELNNTVTAFKVEENGGLQIIQNIPSLPEGFSGTSWAADIWLHPSGKWLYASNRGHNSIVRYKVKEVSGKLELEDYTSTEGKTPRGFSISEDGNFLFVANQDSGNLSVFSIAADGSLKLKSSSAEVPTPVRIELVE